MSNLDDQIALVRRKLRALEKEKADIASGEKCYACGGYKQYVANDGTPFHVCTGGAGDPL